MFIQKVSQVTGELYEAVKRLVPQLGAHKVPPSEEELKELVNAECSILLIARESGPEAAIVGMLSLTIYRVPTGMRSIIEDVVVDRAARRKGIGEALVRHALELARDAGAVGVALTSNPQREAANKLYQSIGFELRHTNPYFYSFE